MLAHLLAAGTSWMRADRAEDWKLRGWLPTSHSRPEVDSVVPVVLDRWEAAPRDAVEDTVPGRLVWALLDLHFSLASSSLFMPLRD